MLAASAASQAAADGLAGIFLYALGLLGPATTLEASGAGVHDSRRTGYPRDEQHSASAVSATPTTGEVGANSPMSLTTRKAAGAAAQRSLGCAPSQWYAGRHHKSYDHRAAVADSAI